MSAPSTPPAPSSSAAPGPPRPDHVPEKLWGIMSDSDKSGVIDSARRRNEVLMRATHRSLMRRILALQAEGCTIAGAVTFTIGVNIASVGPGGETPDSMIEGVKRSDMYAAWYKYDRGAYVDATGNIVGGRGYFTWHDAGMPKAFGVASLPGLADDIMRHESEDDEAIIRHSKVHDDIMWRVSFEYGEKQRRLAAEAAANQRDTDLENAERRHQDGLRIGRISAIVAVLSAVVAAGFAIWAANIQANATLKAGAPAGSVTSAPSVATAAMTQPPASAAVPIVSSPTGMPPVSSASPASNK